MNPSLAQLDIYRTAIPMRSFEHAAARRNVAEAVLVRVQLSDGSQGWGETLPRPYVTGETIESVIADIQGIFWPMLRAEGRLAECETLEGPQGRRVVTAARCAVELAWQDAAARSEGRSLHGPIGREVRASGVLGSSDPAKTRRQLRLMWWYGLRHFKLKLGLGQDVDRANLTLVSGVLGKAIAHGKASLRVDVNGGWKAEETPARVAELMRYHVCLVEQPVYGPAEMLLKLAHRCQLPLLADESLLTLADARAIVAGSGQKLWLNIRISKNGGLDAARRMAQLAGSAKVPFVLGCMVGETGVLSSAQRALLAGCPAPRYVEGNFGRFLLSADLTDPSPRFGLGGRLRPLGGAGLGVRVRADRLSAFGKLLTTLRP